MVRQDFALRLAAFFACLSVAVTISHALFFVLSPYESDYAEASVWSLILLFQLLLTAGAWLGCRAILQPVTRSSDLSKYEALVRSSTFRTLLVFSTVGLALHLIAKWPLIEQAELGCFGQLRELWLAVDHSSQPLWRRASSMAGHLFANFYLPGVFMGTFAITSGLSPRRGAFFSGCFLIVGVIYAAAIVSRSAMFTLFVVTLLGAGLALAALQSGFQRGLLRAVSLLSAVLAIALTFNHMVFSSKIDCVRGHAEEYAASNAASMSIQEKSAYAPTGFHLSCDMCRPTLLYLNHGVWNFQMIMASEKRGDPVLRHYLTGLFARLGIFTKPDKPNRVYGRGGSTLPGAAFHDYGKVGLVTTAFLLAAMFVLSVALIRRGGRLLWPGAALFVAVGVSEAMSLLFVAPATLSFPFLAIAFVTTAAMTPAAFAKRTSS